MVVVRNPDSAWQVTTEWLRDIFSLFSHIRWHLGTNTQNYILQEIVALKDKTHLQYLLASE